MVFYPESMAANEYKIFSLAESARVKGMWAGALERTNIPGLSGIYRRGGGEEEPVGPPEPAKYEVRPIGQAHTPALLKIIDEGLVNASDHWKENERQSRAVDRVRSISLEFDPNSGKLAIENDGPGIPVVRHEQASASAGHAVYIPEVAFAIFLAGRNMEKPPDSVKGGINGIGAKLINVHSTRFEVETVGLNERGAPALYTQAFENRMIVRGEPAICLARNVPMPRRRPHTRITFVPAYEALGYKFVAGKLSASDAADLEAWCRWRLFVLAAYVGSKVKVTFNGEACPTTCAKDLASLAINDPNVVIMECSAKSANAPYSAHPWDIAVAIIPSQRKSGQISVINGVYCTKGSHVTYLKKTLSDAVVTKLTRITKAKDKKPTVTDTCKHIFLVTIGALPGADWGGQRKDELQVSNEKLGNYVIPPTTLGKIATVIAAGLLQETEKSAGRKKAVDADKYTRARRAGTADRGRCCLLAAEGDSALSLFRAGLTLGPKKNPGGPTFEYYGMISLGGVIMNALKKTTKITSSSGETVLVRSEQLRKNKALKAIVEVLGLDYTLTYATTKERQTLSYGCLIIGTDQDHDGAGKIRPLVLSFFHLFWPELIRVGYVKCYETPVVRAYPKQGGGAPREFLRENDFVRWMTEQGGEASVISKYRIKYYKGLGGHDKASGEVASMFKRFSEFVYTYTLDDSTAHLFDIYFGNRPSLRKIALATPVKYLSYEEAQEIHRSRLIPCRVQLEVDAKACKLDFIQRQIPGIDGIPVARRKILAACLRRFSTNNKELKVFQLGGYVAEHMFYHHGEASLNWTIIGMAQRFPGALHFPYLIGIGEFGTRHFAGNDASSPRYIDVRLAGRYTKAMFPAEDTWLLPHVFEDGERAQPEYFLPVLPTPLLESFEIPSEGWRHKSFARDLDQVVRLLKAYIGEGVPEDIELVAAVARAAVANPSGGLAQLEVAKALPAGTVSRLRERFPLDISLRRYGKHLSESERKELVRPYKGGLYSFGWYVPEHNVGGKAGVSNIRVLELPLRKSTKSFLKELKKPARAKYIDWFDDYSSTNRVDICIKLLPGAWDSIMDEYGNSETDPIEDFLLLRTSLKPFLNYYGRDGRVLEFGEDYHAVFFHVAPLRRTMYGQRLERRAAIIRLKILREKNLVRYIESSQKLGISLKASEGDAIEALAAQEFSQLDSGLLDSPRYTLPNQLESMVTKGQGVSYDYILNLRERDLVTAAKDKRLKSIGKLESELQDIEKLLAEKPFAGASVWAAEVDAAVAAIAYGEKTKWRFAADHKGTA